MPSIPDTKTFKMQSGALYGLLTYYIGTDSFDLVPTDASYNPITLSTIDDSYFAMHAEAKRLVALELGQGVLSIAELEQRIAWTQDVIDFDVNHSGGTWNIATGGDDETFHIAIKEALTGHINDLLNG